MMKVKLIIFILLQCYNLIFSLYNHISNRSNLPIVKNIKKNYIRTSHISMVDIPLIPTILIATAGIFAVFNIENPIDLTDEGRRQARLKKRADRLAKGELPKSTEGLDPYRFKIFEDDNEDDIDLIGGSSRKGGCG